MPATLAELTGWWTGITTGDLDGDGRPDLIVGNWGLNSSYHQPSLADPVRVWYGDFDENGTMDLLEAETESGTGRIVPRRDLGFLALGWPAIRTRFSSHHEFSRADIPAVLGPDAAKARELRAVTLSSMVLLQRGDHFEVMPLPPEAQWAPVSAVAVADADGDGYEDVFLSQNCFAMRLEEPRLDAGRGLWLRGDGTGRLAAMPGELSGVKIHGDQRGAALADFDEDGRVDLVVGQNNGPTALYHNVGSRPGFIVRLAGPVGNPGGIGASVWLQFGDRSGPVREIHGGSGYLSQDSATLVLAAPRVPTHVLVRWPGGRLTTNAVQAGARSMAISYASGARAP